MRYGVALTSGRQPLAHCCAEWRRKEGAGYP